MLRKLTSILLIVSILTAVGKYTLPYLWYYSNYDYIAQELCENRHDPDTECDGKCQLKKKMEKQHDHKDEQPAPPVINEQRINLYFPESNNLSLTQTNSSHPFFSHNDDVNNLWLGEPDSPPPQGT